MSRLTRTARAALAIAVLSAGAGCGSGDADRTPNPALGPPPQLKPGRANEPVVLPVDKGGKQKKAK